MICEPGAILSLNSETNLSDNFYAENMQTDISHVDFGQTRFHRILRLFYPKDRIMQEPSLPS